MPTADFHIGEGDTLPKIRATLQDEDGNAVDLTSVSSVRFHMKKTNKDEVVVDAAASVVDGVNGIVEYTWIVTDTADAGVYDAEFEVNFIGGGIETFPNDRNLKIQIKEQIA